MADKKRCVTCHGSGKVMGGGMMMYDCDDCDGRGKIAVINDDIAELNIRTTESYAKAIDEIKKIDPSITDEKAQEIFDKELENIQKDEKKNKGRK